MKYKPTFKTRIIKKNLAMVHRFSSVDGPPSQILLANSWQHIPSLNPTTVKLVQYFFTVLWIRIRIRYRLNWVSGSDRIQIQDAEYCLLKVRHYLKRKTSIFWTNIVFSTVIFLHKEPGSGSGSGTIFTKQILGPDPDSINLDLQAYVPPSQASDVGTDTL
jgi:hypothetical protein